MLSILLTHLATAQKRILGEFVPSVERLMDIYARGWTMPLTPDQQKAARRYIQRISANHTFPRIHQKAQRMERSEDAEDSLAARLYGHDLITEITYCQGMASLLAGGDPPALTSEIVHTFMRKLTMFRLFGLTMGYLASEKDPAYMVSFPPSQLEELLTSSSKQSREVQVYSARPMSNVEYVALHQIVKNAPTRWGLYVMNRGPQIVYMIEDYGYGIRHKDKDKTPLRAEELPQLFGDFSTNERGLGLQVAKELIHSIEGYIEVISTTNRATVRYSTADNSTETRESSGYHGTLFSVYVPRNPVRTLSEPQSLGDRTFPDPHSAVLRPERVLAS